MKFKENLYFGTTLLPAGETGDKVLAAVKEKYLPLLLSLSAHDRVLQFGGQS